MPLGARCLLSELPRAVLFAAADLPTVVPTFLSDARGVFPKHVRRWTGPFALADVDRVPFPR